MKCKIISVMVAFTAIIFVSASCRTAKSHAARPCGSEDSAETANTGASNTNYDEANAKLVEALRNIPVEGPSLGGPVQGISTNAATEAVVRKGSAIIPTLISALDRSTWAQSVWIVFCLEQLRAKEAKERILKLQQEIDSGRFAYQGNDLTLQAIIQGYLTVTEGGLIQPPP